MDRQSHVFLTSYSEDVRVWWSSRRSQIPRPALTRSHRIYLWAQARGHESLADSRRKGLRPRRHISRHVHQMVLEYRATDLQRPVGGPSRQKHCAKPCALPTGSESLAFLRSPRFLLPLRPFPLCAVVRHVPGEMRLSCRHLGGLVLLSCRNCLDSARYTSGPQSTACSVP